MSHQSDVNPGDLDHIPGNYGVPFLGDSIPFLRDLLKFSKNQHDRYGDVSKTNLAGHSTVVVFGAENYEQIFRDKSQNFSTELGYKEQLGSFYKGGLLLRDFDEHRVQRRIFQSAFKIDALKAYFDQINPSVESSLEDWPAALELYPKIKRIILALGAKVFVGVSDLGQDAAVLNEAFLNTSIGLTALIRKDIPLPGFKYHKGVKGKNYLHKYFKAMIPQRRCNYGEDIFSHICRERNSNGKFFSDEEVIAHMSFLLFAGHDTTTSLLTNLCLELAQNLPWQSILRDEINALDASRCTYELLNELPLMDLAINETLRLHPSIQVLVRRALRSTVIGGHEIPEGTQLFMPICQHQRLENCWSKPDQFDPKRFSAERAEHKTHSFNFVPFGGGAHKCIGLHMAGMITKCFMFKFLKQYRFNVAEDYVPKHLYLPLSKPADDLPVSVTALYQQ